MTGTVVEFPHRSDTAAIASEAPPLPIEHHIVAAALSAERLRAATEQMLLLLRHAPRNADAFARIHGEMLDAWCEVDSHYGAYRAVIECKGQA